VRRRRSSTTGWWAAGARPRRKGRVLDGPYDQERQQVRLGADLRRRPYHRLQHPAPHAFPYHRPRLRLVPLRGRSSTRRAGPHLVVAGVVLQGRCWPMIARRHGRAAATLPASYWAAIPHRPARCCLICRLPLVVTDSGGVCWFHKPSVTMSSAATTGSTASSGRARHSLVDPARAQTATTRRCGGDETAVRPHIATWPSDGLRLNRGPSARSCC